MRRIEYISIRNRSSVKVRSSRGIEPADAFRGPFIRCETRLLSSVSVRSWFRRGRKGRVKVGVCMRTYSTTSAAALDRIDMFGTRLLRLRIRRTPDTTIHSSQNRKSQCERRRGIVQTFQVSRSIDHSMRPIPVVRVVNRICQEQWWIYSSRGLE